ncbi:aspartate aminotransferase family protein [Pendulispora albinea]|uniref:Aminotransferase class III-fold pyridoxal phosphate-dependent enzyme n=1 Tax=Pendulispora albinea TaxID=2741071 RepID=A0ABZ2LPY0_9BACT
MTSADASSDSVHSASIEARRAFVERNPESRAGFESACQAMPGGNTRTVLFHEPFPLRIARGEGCRIWDADGHEYIDFLGEFTAGLFGHSHPDITAAVKAAIDNGISLSGHNTLEARFAGAVCARFPSLELVRFTNSGTEANLLAIATAKVATGRSKVLVFDGAYHGSLLSFAGGGLPINVPHAWVVGTYNDVAGTEALFDAHGPELAAVLVEPMLGAGGCVPGEPAFLEMLRARTCSSGALLIFDEVMTSRLAPGGRQGELGIRPDLTTLGKYIAGGMSFGAFGGRRELMSLYDPRQRGALPHAGTFNNNVLTMSAGLAALRVLTPEVTRALNLRGDALRLRLDALCKAARANMLFTGIGSMLTVHFTDRPVRSGADVAAGDAALKELFFFEMLAHGIYFARRGMMALSLPIGDLECDRLASAVESFLTRHRALLQSSSG